MWENWALLSSRGGGRGKFDEVLTLIQGSSCTRSGLSTRFLRLLWEVRQRLWGRVHVLSPQAKCIDLRVVGTAGLRLAQRGWKKPSWQGTRKIKKSTYSYKCSGVSSNHSLTWTYTLNGWKRYNKAVYSRQGLAVSLAMLNHRYERQYSLAT